MKGALQNARVSALLVDTKNRLWVETYKGMYLYNPAADDFQAFFQNGEEGRTLSDNTVLCLAEDLYGNIWAGTQFGLNKISGIQGDKLLVQHYTTREGLPNDYVHAVMPDDKGNIWASTNKGIVRLDRTSSAVFVFDKRDGILSDVFAENASFRDADGRMFFGGVNGLTSFVPDSITISRFTPPLYFTNLKVNNQPCELGQTEGNSRILTKPLYETKSITLNYQKTILKLNLRRLITGPLIKTNTCTNSKASIMIG